MKRLYIDAKTSNEKIAGRKINSLLKIAKDSGLRLPKDEGIKLTVKFDIKSVRFAGQAVNHNDNKNMDIRIHPKALEKYKKDYIESTIPHEVAHILQFVNYPHSTAHGQVFKSIMRLFGLPGKRTHNYDLRSLSTTKKRKTVTYKCGCQEHKVSSLIDRRIQAGSERICRKCRCTLIKKEI